MELIVSNLANGKTIRLEGFEYHFSIETHHGDRRMFIFSNIEEMSGSLPDSNDTGRYLYSFVARSTSNELSRFESRFGNSDDEEHFDRISRGLDGIRLGTVDEGFNDTYDIESIFLDEISIDNSSHSRTSVDKSLSNDMRMDFKLKGVIGGNRYNGRNSYHSKDMDEINQMKQGGSEKYPYWVGIELEVETNNDNCLNYLKSLKSNWFYVERDSSLDHDYGCEIVTIKMNPKVACDVKTWEELCNNLSLLGAKSHDTSTCGFHVHVSKTAFGETTEEQDETIGRLIHLYHNELGGSGDNINYIAMVMRRSYTNYAKNVLDGVGDNLESMYRFTRNAGLGSVSASYTKDAFKDLSSGDKQNGRYVAINRRNTHTVEFRQGKGTLKPSSIVAMIQFCCEMVEFSRKSTNKTCNRRKFLERINKLKEGNELKKLLINR